MKNLSLSVTPSTRDMSCSASLRHFNPFPTPIFSYEIQYNNTFGSSVVLRRLQ